MKAKLLSRLGIEVWKNIPEFESYQVSNLGNVKSLKYGKERMLKQSTNGVGYYQIGIYGNKKRIQKTVNQTMAIAFLSHKPCGHKIVVDHIDNNKLNNKLYNLQLITHRENISNVLKSYNLFELIGDEQINRYPNIPFEQLGNSQAGYPTNCVSIYDTYRLK